MHLYSPPSHPLGYPKYNTRCTCSETESSAARVLSLKGLEGPALLRSPGLVKPNGYSRMVTGQLIWAGLIKASAVPK
jgi:hypothetical protein